MDSIGDYVYLIVLVIAALSGILGKRKKAETNSAPAKPKRSWEDVLRDLTSIEDIEEETKEEVTEEKAGKPSMAWERKAEPAPEMSYETLADTSVLKATKQVAKNPSHLSTTLAEHKTATTTDNVGHFMFNSVEDARKAFIYSEIFNRKY